MLDQYPQVSWKAIMRFRDFLSHQYDNVDLNTVWDAVVQLTSLRTAVEQMIAQTAQDDANRPTGE
ncbi:MAG: HepT-like ribonuclease domain-containing protein [Anaerolineae bacterium]